MILDISVTNLSRYIDNDMLFLSSFIFRNEYFTQTFTNQSLLMQISVGTSVSMKPKVTKKHILIVSH